MLVSLLGNPRHQTKVVKFSNTLQPSVWCQDDKALPSLAPFQKIDLLEESKLVNIVIKLFNTILLKIIKYELKHIYPS